MNDENVLGFELRVLCCGIFGLWLLLWIVGNKNSIKLLWSRQSFMTQWNTQHMLIVTLLIPRGDTNIHLKMSVLETCLICD